MSVNRSGYYKWKARQGKKNRYERDRELLTKLLQEVQLSERRRDGLSRTIWHINAVNMPGSRQRSITTDGDLPKEKTNCFRIWYGITGMLINLYSSSLQI